MYWKTRQAFRRRGIASHMRRATHEKLTNPDNRVCIHHVSSTTPQINADVGSRSKAFGHARTHARTDESPSGPAGLVTTGNGGFPWSSSTTNNCLMQHRQTGERDARARGKSNTRNTRGETSRVDRQEGHRGEAGGGLGTVKKGEKERRYRSTSRKKGFGDRGYGGERQLTSLGITSLPARGELRIVSYVWRSVIREIQTRRKLHSATQRNRGSKEPKRRR